MMIVPEASQKETSSREEDVSFYVEIGDLEKMSICAKSEAVSLTLGKVLQAGMSKQAKVTERHFLCFPYFSLISEENLFSESPQEVVLITDSGIKRSVDMLTPKDREQIQQKTAYFSTVNITHQVLPSIGEHTLIRWCNIGQEIVGVYQRSLEAQGVKITSNYKIRCDTKNGQPFGLEASVWTGEAHNPQKLIRVKLVQEEKDLLKEATQLTEAVHIEYNTAGVPVKITAKDSAELSLDVIQHASLHAGETRGRIGIAQVFARQLNPDMSSLNHRLNYDLTLARIQRSVCSQNPDSLETVLRQGFIFSL